ncbi:MAG: flagellar motor switch protein FliG [Planctomycetota bacterium]|jgi:flagellar motor switch protein FliG
MPLLGRKKIAALLLNIDRDAAARILKNFREDDIIAIGEAMNEISGKDIPREELDVIYQDFREMLQQRSGVFRPRTEEMEKLLHSSLGPEKTKEILSQLQHRFIPTSPFTALGRYPKQILAKILKNEHPQTVALVLSQIESNRSARVIAEMDEDLRLDVLTRIARLKTPPMEILTQISNTMKEKANQALVEESPEEAQDRLRTVADVLNRVDRQTEKSVLGKIAEDNAEMAEEIKELMFTFEDLLLVDHRAMQKILSGINVQVLAMALKGANKELELFIMGNVSKRVKKLIEDEKELMGAKPVEDVVEAQKEIVNTVRALIESGEIQINRASEEELLV